MKKGIQALVDRFIGSLRMPWGSAAALGLCLAVWSWGPCSIIGNRALGDDVIVYGQAGANGANGAPGTPSSPGGNGQAGGNGGLAQAVSNNPLSLRNYALAVGGNGGRGGDGGDSMSSAFNPGLGGDGGRGGDAIANAIVSSGAGFREAIAQAVGGRGGDVGLGGKLFESSDRTTPGSGGNGGNATATASAISISGSISIEGSARGGQAGGGVTPSGILPCFGGSASVTLSGSATENLTALGVAVGGGSQTSSGTSPAASGGNAFVSANLHSQGNIAAQLRSEGGKGGDWIRRESGTRFAGAGGIGSFGPISISFGATASVHLTSIGGSGGKGSGDPLDSQVRGGRGGDASLIQTLTIDQLSTASLASINQTAEGGSGGEGVFGGAGGNAISQLSHTLSLTDQLSLVATSRGGEGGLGLTYLGGLGGVGGSAVAQAHARNLNGKARSQVVAIGGKGGAGGGYGGAGRGGDGGAAITSASAEGSEVWINVTATGGNGGVSGGGNAGAGGRASIDSITGIGNVVRINASATGGDGGTRFQGAIEGEGGIAGQASLGMITAIGNRIEINATATGGNGGQAFERPSSDGASVSLDNRLRYLSLPTTTMVSLTQTARGGNGGHLVDWGARTGRGGNAESILQIVGGVESINLNVKSYAGRGGWFWGGEAGGPGGGPGLGGAANSLGEASSTASAVTVNAEAFGGEGGRNLSREYPIGFNPISGGNATAKAQAHSLSNVSASAIATGGRGGLDMMNNPGPSGNAVAIAKGTSTQGKASVLARATGNQVQAEANAVGREARATAIASGNQGSAKASARATPLATRWLYAESSAQASVGSTASTYATASARGVFFGPAQGANHEAFSFVSTHLSVADTISRIGHHANIAAALGVDPFNQTMADGVVGIADFGGRFAPDGTVGSLYSRTHSGAFFWDRSLPNEKVFYVGLFDGQEQGTIQQWEFMLSAPDAGFLRSWSSIDTDWENLFGDNVFALQDLDPSQNGLVSVFWSLTWLTGGPETSMSGSVLLFTVVPEPSAFVLAGLAMTFLTSVFRRRRDKAGY